MKELVGGAESMLVLGLSCSVVSEVTIGETTGVGSASAASMSAWSITATDVCRVLRFAELICTSGSAGLSAGFTGAGAGVAGVTEAGAGVEGVEVEGAEGVRGTVGRARDPPRGLDGASPEGRVGALSRDDDGLVTSPLVCVAVRGRPASLDRAGDDGVGVTAMDALGDLGAWIAGFIGVTGVSTGADGAPAPKGST